MLVHVISTYTGSLNQVIVISAANAAKNDKVTWFLFLENIYKSNDVRKANAIFTRGEVCGVGMKQTLDFMSQKFQTFSITD